MNKMVTALTGVFLMAGSGLSFAQVFTPGLYDAPSTLEAFRSVGSAEQVDGKNVEGSIEAPDGQALPYTAELMLCENDGKCSNILVRHSWEAPRDDMVRCVLDAWPEPQKYGSSANFNFSGVRFIKDVTGDEGSKDAPSIQDIAQSWKAELLEFHALTQSGKC
ncbi:hypothetical protein ABFT80_18440 [Mesorhizobium sp. SB112]|uniref:hypothetical protein n=1 Tax=Mesorhizobium sp. SB112 TaxID=3151853 RepID=UPI0032676C07